MLGHKIDVYFIAQETGKQFYKEVLTFYPQIRNIEEFQMVCKFTKIYYCQSFSSCYYLM